ncbi:hypothetical protein C8Q78DRAFT_809469 [Trametes maxima]|nr:hypothetical protein C8Q78DRAFT_809469 [Trametes maxima]
MRPELECNGRRGAPVIDGVTEEAPLAVLLRVAASSQQLERSYIMTSVRTLDSAAGAVLKTLDTTRVCLPARPHPRYPPVLIVQRFNAHREAFKRPPRHGHPDPTFHIPGSHPCTPPRGSSNIEPLPPPWSPDHASYAQPAATTISADPWGGSHGDRPSRKLHGRSVSPNSTPFAESTKCDAEAPLALSPNAIPTSIPGRRRSRLAPASPAGILTARSSMQA